MKYLRAGAVCVAANAASTVVPVHMQLLTRVQSDDEYGHIVSFALFATLITTLVAMK